MTKARILALGNILVKDDGVGPFLLAVLEAHWDFPADVDLVEAGTPGFDLLPMVEDVECLIILDAVKGPGAPGSVHCSNQEDILKSGLPQHCGPHDPNLRKVLLEAGFRDRAPKELLLVGVVPADTSVGTELSEAVVEAIPEAEQIVIDKLTNLGISVHKRLLPDAPDVWWLQEASEYA